MRTRWMLWAAPAAFVLTGTAWAQDLPKAEPAIASSVEIVDVVEPAPLVADVEIEVKIEGQDPCGEADAEASALVSQVAEDVVDEATAAAPGGCKPCKGRTWCKCTYNGSTRASCDPCCYRNNFGTLVCLD